MLKRITAPLPVVPVLLLVSLPVAGAGKTEQQVSSPQEYAGSVACLECHEDRYKDYRKSVHFQTETGHYPEKGCEACHGPGARHIEAEGDVQYIFSFNRPHTVEEKIGKCLACHGERENSYNYLSGNHKKGTIDCWSCHKPHEAAGRDKLLPESVYKTCLGCHQEVAAGINLNERHRILEGMVKCTDCHNNHAQSPRERLGGFKHEKCFTCHTDKGGPWVFEHLSSRVEGCTACHQSPHGSVNRHMIAYQRVAELCFSCHTEVPGFHTRFNNTTNCTNCHSQIHGSNLHAAFLK